MLSYLTHKTLIYYQLPIIWSRPGNTKFRTILAGLKTAHLPYSQRTCLNFTHDSRQIYDFPSLIRDPNRLPLTTLDTKNWYAPVITLHHSTIAAMFTILSILASTCVYQFHKSFILQPKPNPSFNSPSYVQAKESMCSKVFDLAMFCKDGY